MAFHDITSLTSYVIARFSYITITGISTQHRDETSYDSDKEMSIQQLFRAISRLIMIDVVRTITTNLSPFGGQTM